MQAGRRKTQLPSLVRRSLTNRVLHATKLPPRSVKWVTWRIAFGGTVVDRWGGCTGVSLSSIVLSVNVVSQGTAAAAAFSDGDSAR